MLLGFDVFKSSLESIDFANSKVINTINPHSYCISKNDKIFEKALKSSDVLLPDGIGIVLAENFLNNQKIKKIAGFDLFLFLMQKLDDENGSVFKKHLIKTWKN
jgi:N-acetylglucosaminyldiphosphoundecaprenol N-acetyl-beta-D-mannosaminyltransferase